MKIQRTALVTILLAAILYGALGGIVAGEQTDVERRVTARLKQARTLEEFEQAAFTIQRHRSELIDTLIRMLRKEDDEERKIRICYLLGEYRASEAAMDLASNITLEAQVPPATSSMLRWYQYPAWEALVKCGNRSIPHILRSIESNDDELRQKLSAQGLWQIMSEGLPHKDAKEHARMVIQKRIKEVSDPTKKTRLEASLRFLN